ncbi:hypothetical protein ACIPRD_12310 [Streptomyces sp. NPDC090108]|uniref:Rv1733c family protein n=1 Tax=Streptomyces sp. NPDC090108 TaxID=3365947 RepID=UPI003813C0C3
MRSRTQARGWRWRPNPLRRRSDVVEAWTFVVVAVLLFVVAPLTGVAAGLRAHGTAEGHARTQRAERHAVRAVVLGRTDEQLPLVRDDRRHPYRAEVRWSEPGTGSRTAAARVPAGTRADDVVTVWFDGRGRNVSPPPDAVAVWQHAVSIGLCAAGGAAGTVLAAHAVQRRVALRHRLDEWEREWALTGPRWSRPLT